MGRWISCPPRSNTDCLITLLFHSAGTVTTDTFSWYFVHPQQKRERYKLIVWWTNLSPSSSADGLMALMAVAGWSWETDWRQERLVWTPGSWMYVSCMWGYMVLLRRRGWWKMCVRVWPVLTLHFGSIAITSDWLPSLLQSVEPASPLSVVIFNFGLFISTLLFYIKHVVIYQNPLKLFMWRWCWK